MELGWGWRWMLIDGFLMIKKYWKFQEKVISLLAHENIDFCSYLSEKKAPRAVRRKMWMNFLWINYENFFLSSAYIIISDISDGNGNFSGGESEDGEENEKDKECFKG